MKEKQEKCYLTLTANAGYGISMGGKNILVDALHDSPSGGWASVGGAIYRMMNNSIAFKNPEAIIITHGHDDHFSLNMTMDFLRKYAREKNETPIRVIAPSDVLDSIWEGVKMEALMPVILEKMNDRRTFFFNDMELRAFKIPHDGKKYSNCLHYGFLLSYKGKNILSTGDGELCSEVILREAEALRVTGEDLDLAIVNFPWITLKNAREFLVEKIRPKNIAICHLPFEEQDRFGYGKATIKAVENMPEDINWVIMNKAMKQEELIL